MTDICRLLRPDEATDLVCAVREMFGETYPDKLFYDAEELAARISRGSLLSMGAFKDDGTLFGHLSAVLDDHSLPYLYCGFVLPAYRGHNILQGLMLAIIDTCRASGAVGIQLEVVCSHPAAQKQTERVGGRVVGYLCACIPPTVAYSEGACAGKAWNNTFYYFIPLSQGGTERVWLPDSLHKVVHEIYDELGIVREIMSPASAQSVSIPVCEESLGEINISRSSGWNVGSVEIRSYGHGLVEKLTNALETMHDQGVSCRHVMLPLHHPQALVLAESCLKAGYGFGALIPRLVPEGDVLLLQRFDQDRFHTELDICVSDYAQRIRALCLDTVGISAFPG